MYAHGHSVTVTVVVLVASEITETYVVRYRGKLGGEVMVAFCKPELDKTRVEFLVNAWVAVGSLGMELDVDDGAVVSRYAYFAEVAAEEANDEAVLFSVIFANNTACACAMNSDVKANPNVRGNISKERLIRRDRIH